MYLVARATGYFCLMKYLFLMLALCSCGVVFGQAQAKMDAPSSQMSWVELEDSAIDGSVPVLETERNPKRAKIRRGVAILLALALGPFGVHRLYLGTSEKVPLFYSLTIGGLLILPIVDIFCILFSKDFEQYQGNDRVVMW